MNAAVKINTALMRSGKRERDNIEERDMERDKLQYENVRVRGIVVRAVRIS